MVPLRSNPVDTVSAAPTCVRAATGIALAAGSLAPFDQQCVRTMLRTLATHLSAYVRVVDDRESDLSLIPDPGNENILVLRARNGHQLRLPRPLRLMPLADGLNAMIDIVRPHSASASERPQTEMTLTGSLRGTPFRTVQLDGAWGRCWVQPQTEQVAFDRAFEHVARALANSDEVSTRSEVAAVAEADIKLRLRGDEVRWLCRPAADLQRVTAVKLTQPNAELKLRIWPNLARLPRHDRWIAVFAAMQDGISAPDLLRLAAAEGIPDSETRRGLTVLLQEQYAVSSVREVARLRPAARIPLAEPSFLQRLRSRLLQMLDAA